MRGALRFRLAVVAALLLVPTLDWATPPRPLTPGQHLRQAPAGRALPAEGQVATGRFLSRQHAARGPRARGGPGDYFVRSAELLCVLSARDGSLIDLAAGPDFVDGFGWGRVQVCQGTARHELIPQGFSLISGPRRALEVRGRVAALGLEVRTRYRTPPGRHLLEMESEIRNLGPRALEDLALCEELGLGNTRLQVPGVGQVRRSQTLEALFAAREEAGVSYLLVRPDGKPLRFPLELPHPLLAFDPVLRVEHERGRLEPGGTRLVRRLLAVRPGPPHQALAETLAASTVPTLEASVEPGEELVLAGAPPAQLQVRLDGKPFLLTTASRSMRLVLPRGGRYTVALRVPGAGEGPAVPLPPRGAARPLLPARGRLLVSVVDEAGSLLPARLRIRGEGDTPSPAFGADHGLRVENQIYLGAAPELLLLAPGAYRLDAGRGPHYELAEARLRLTAGQTRRLRLVLRKAVRTAGWLSADLHQHTSSSFDCPVRPAERLAAAASLGLDLIALTDHNVVTAGPRPTASQPGPGQAPSPLLVLPGQEVTSEGRLIGHFNVFPLAPGAEINARDTSPALVFAEARRRRPPPLVQVNHPRMEGIGYFQRTRLAPERAAAAYHPGYDLLEVLNGDELDQPKALEAVLGDWYHLLNRGERHTATAGSDGHRLAIQEVGSPRTLILWDPTEKGGTPTLEAALEALRAGRVVASSGPFVRFSLEQQPIGSLLRGGRPLRMNLQVEAPSWMDVSAVTLVANGVPLQSFRPGRGSGRRLEVKRWLQPKVDTWYVVVVRGDKEDPSLLRRGVFPFAVTNPIFVDVDGDGRCLPPSASRPAGAHPKADERDASRLD